MTRIAAERNETHRLRTLAKVTKPLTIRLDGPDYQRLEEEARGLGMRPGTLARVILHANLAGTSATPGSAPARLAALERLTALSRGRPTADAVRLVADAREDIGAQPAR